MGNVATDQSEITVRDEEQPGSSKEHQVTQQPPAKRSRKDSSSSKNPTLERSLTPRNTLTQEPTREHSAVVDSVLSHQSSFALSAEAQPGTSGIPPIMPSYLPQSSQGIMTPPSATVGGVQDTSFLQHESSCNRAALVPFSVQPFGFETTIYNSGQHPRVAGHSSQIGGPHADNRQCVTVTSKYMLSNGQEFHSYSLCRMKA